MRKQRLMIIIGACVIGSLIMAVVCLLFMVCRRRVNQSVDPPLGSVEVDMHRADMYEVDPQPVVASNSKVNFAEVGEPSYREQSPSPSQFTDEKRPRNSSVASKP